MIISGTGAQPEITWSGGSGTVSIVEITPAMNLPKIPADIDGNPDKPTIPGLAGGWDPATTIEIEVSFNGGNTWLKATQGGCPVVFQDDVLESKTFEVSACKMRANITGTAPTGIGLLLGINSTNAN